MENVIGTHSAGTYIHTYNKIFFYIENKNIIINNLIGKQFREILKEYNSNRKKKTIQPKYQTCNR